MYEICLKTQGKKMVISFVHLSVLLLLLLESTCGSKNILLLVVDDLRPSLGVYGDENAHTPNIDKLGREGVVFHEAFAQQALCAPSRNSFLTSRRPDTLRLYDFYNYWRTFSGNFTTLPQYFKDNSYITKSIGKIFHPGKSSNFTDDYPLSWSEPPWHPPSEAFKNKAVCYEEDGWFTNLICPVRLEEQPNKTLPDIESLNEAIAFLKSRKGVGKPFFLAVGFHKPHIPLKFPRHFLEYHDLNNVSLPSFRRYPPGLPEVSWNPWMDIRWRHDIALLNLSFPFEEINDHFVKLIRQSYFASVTYIDELIGKLLKSLQIMSLDGNTIIVLVGDHGWALGEHGEWSKYSNFDVALRVPLIFRIPHLTYFIKNEGKDKSERKNSLHWNGPVELVDVFPTIVDLAGLRSVPKCPKESKNVVLCTEGKSLIPLMLNTLSGKLEKWDNESQAFSQYPRPGLFPTRHPNSDKPRLSEIKVMGYSIRTRRYRYTEWIKWNHINFQGDWRIVYGVELYDHLIDPDENLNIADRPGLEVIKKMLKTQLRNRFELAK